MAPKKAAPATKGARSKATESGTQLKAPITAAATTINTTEPPSTPVHPNRGPFQVQPYKPPPLAIRPPSPGGEAFDFQDAYDVLLTPSPKQTLAPALGAMMGSPIKRARAKKGSDLLVNQRTDIDVWDLSDDEIIGT